MVLGEGDAISSSLPDEPVAAELNDSHGPTLESAWAWWSVSSTLSVEGLLFLGIGGSGDADRLLWPLSSAPGGGSVVRDFFACFLECIATNGCSSLLIPGHGAVTETSLQGKCS
ncbi:hypothetical protein HanIR_Chr06g0277471 [Helianthus annuus]|nr:hypothetical protein HanIR_Chr06g0277471 [Helianthus annuus]